MSLASVHPMDLHSSHGSLITLSRSLDDITALSLNWTPHQVHHNHSEHVLTIEELRLEMTTCFSCGVCWSDSHVSLDCSECGGYALERPCPVCEGACGATWKRDLSMSHDCGKAKWQGACSRKSQEATPTLLQAPPSDNSANLIAAHELSTRLEKLSANS